MPPVHAPAAVSAAQTDAPARHNTADDACCVWRSCASAPRAAGTIPADDLSNGAAVVFKSKEQTAGKPTLRLFLAPVPAGAVAPPPPPASNRAVGVLVVGINGTSATGRHRRRGMLQEEDTRTISSLEEALSVAVESVVRHVVPGSVKAVISGYEISGELVITGLPAVQFDRVAVHQAFLDGFALDAGVPVDAVQLERAVTNPDGSLKVPFSIQGFNDTDAGWRLAESSLDALQAQGGMAFSEEALAAALVLPQGDPSVSCAVAPGAATLAVYTVTMEVESSAETGAQHLYSTAGSGVLEAAVQEALASEGSKVASYGVFVGPASTATVQRVLTHLQLATSCTTDPEGAGAPPAPVGAGPSSCPTCAACPVCAPTPATTTGLLAISAAPAAGKAAGLWQMMAATIAIATTARGIAAF